MADLPHLNDAGEAHMVDVSGKEVTQREAVAEADVNMSPGLAERFFMGDIPKGDAAAVVRVAGLMAAKKTAELIPLCHPIPIDGAEVELEPTGHGVKVLATVRTTSRTGVEMEALTAVAIAALTVYDMVKGMERDVEIVNVRLLKKSGGRSGTWNRD